MSNSSKKLNKGTETNNNKGEMEMLEMSSGNSTKILLSMEDIERLIGLKTEIAIKRANSVKEMKKADAVRGNIFNTIKNYVVLIFVAKKLSEVKEERIIVNSSKKCNATPKAPQNNNLMKNIKIIALNNVKNNLLSYVSNRFSSIEIKKQNNEFVIERCWKVTSHNVAILTSSIFNLNNKLNKIIINRFNDNKKSRMFKRISHNSNLNIKIDYDKIIKNGLDINNFDINEKCYFNRCCRFYNTPISSANRSASVSITNLKEEINMNNEIAITLDEDVNEQTISGEEEIYSNVPVITGKSDSPEQMEYLNKLVNKFKYSKSFLLNCITISKEDGKISFKQEYREIGNLGILQFFEINQERNKIIVASKDDEDENYAKDERLYTCNPDGRYRFIDISNGLLLVDFGNLSNKDVENINSKGLYIWKEKDEIKVSIDKPEVEIPVMVRYFRTYIFSPSTLKHNKMYFAEINKDHTIQDRMAEIDALSGECIVKAVKKLQEESKKNNNKNYFAALAKIAVRMAARAATPMLDFGETGNVLVINTKIRPVDEFNSEDAKELKEAGIDIDTDFSDGSLNISVKYIQKMYKKLFGQKLNYRQAKRISLQLRASIVCAKGYGKVYNKEQILRKTIKLCEMYGKDIHLYNEKIDGGIDGETILETLKDETKIGYKEMVKLIQDIDLIGSKNEFKLINFDKLESGAKVEICIINSFNPTESGHSIQQGNKVIDKFAKEYSNLVAVQSVLDLLEQDRLINGGLKLNKDLSGLQGDSIKNCMKLAYDDNDILDKALNIRTLRDKDKFITSKISKMNSNGNSFYLVLTPWDLLLSDMKHVLKKRTINHIDSFGKECTVDTVEGYSAMFNRHYKETLEDLLNSDNLTDEEKSKIEISLHTGVVIKYPTQGKEEFILMYLMTDEEMLNRLNEKEYNFSEEHVVELMDYATISAYSELLLPNDNSLKAQIAGLDFDGDTAKVEIHAIGTNDNNFIYGVLDVKTGKTLNDYVSMCVEITEERNSIYSTACICYLNDNKEVVNKLDYKVNKERKSNNKKSRKNSKNYSSLVRDTKDSKIATINYFNTIKNMTGEFFIMTTTEFKNFASNNINADIFNQVKDILGMLCATGSVGDAIGRTIKSGSVVLLSDIDKVWFPNGVFNFDLACELLIPLGRNVQYFTDGKGKGIDREAEWCEKYESIYREGENLFYITNILGIKRAYYRVSKIEVAEFIKKISKLSRTTSREEWKSLCKDFNHITRGLGESSIDVMKDITKNLGADMTRDIVNSKFSILGNLKSKNLTSNIYEITNTAKNKLYEIDFHKFEIDKNGNTKSPLVLLDPIGAAKIEIYQRLAEEIDNSIKLTKENCNYERYSKYETLANLEDYPATDYSIGYVLDYYTDLFNPNNSSLISPNVETRNNILNALLNMARIEGCSIDEFMKIAIYMGCINRTAKRTEYRVFNTNKGYIAGLNILYLILGDLMVQEFNNSKALNVELTIVNNMQKIPEGKVLDFINGYCVTKGYRIALEEDFTGKAIAIDNKLITSWDAFKEAEKNIDENMILLSIRDLALTKGTFDTFEPDPEGTEGFGINTLTEDRCGKLIAIEDEDEQVLAIEDKDGNAICTLNTLALENLINRNIEDISLIGNIDNGFVLARLSNC